MWPGHRQIHRDVDSFVGQVIRDGQAFGSPTSEQCAADEVQALGLAGTRMAATQRCSLTGALPDLGALAYRQALLAVEATHLLVFGAWRLTAQHVMHTAIPEAPPLRWVSANSFLSRAFSTSNSFGHRAWTATCRLRLAETALPASSSTARPASACFRKPKICCSANRLLLISGILHVDGPRFRSDGAAAGGAGTRFLLGGANVQPRTGPAVRILLGQIGARSRFFWMYVRKSARIRDSSEGCPSG